MRALRRLIPPFVDRFDAGRALADFLDARPRADAVVFGLPRGGAPVGLALAEALDAPLDVVVVRKLPIPANPEMGFGAVAVDGSLILNNRVVEDYRITPTQIDTAVRAVRAEVSRRSDVYRGDRVFPDVRGLDVYLVDDGLATGYTMIAAAKMMRALGPGRLILAVPVSPADSLETLKEYVDEAYCLVAQESGPFAVASFYVDFHDLSDSEVLETLTGHQERLLSKKGVHQYAVR
jgi:putative phosphoribosyl transferase